MTTYTIPIDVPVDPNRNLSGTLTWTEPNPVTPPPRMLLGTDYYEGEMADNLAYFPESTYHRHFGIDYDKDQLPEFPDLRTDKKWLTLSKRPGVVHFSWKDDVQLLVPFLDQLDLAPKHPNLQCWLTRWHESHGDIPPAQYLADCDKMMNILRTHPAGKLIVRNGTAVTRYWLDEKGQDPRTLQYDGMDTFIVDAYNDSTVAYKTSPQMFNLSIEWARRMRMPLAIGELGLKLFTGVDSLQRARKIREHIVYLQRSGLCIATAYWNINESKISSKDVAGKLLFPLELATLQTLVHAH